MYSLQYNFTFTSFVQVVRSFRPIPFSLPCVVWSKIPQILVDGIISISGPSYLNPLTVDVRDGKIPRTCVNAGKINKCTLPDWATFPLIHELLQQFQGSKFVPTTALSSAFLRVAFKPECREYTTFLFHTQACDFTRTPYGFRNSPSAFDEGIADNAKSRDLRLHIGIRRWYPCSFT